MSEDRATADPEDDLDRCDDCRRRRAKQRAEELTEAEWRQLKLEATGPFNRNKAYGVVK